MNANYFKPLSYFYYLFLIETNILGPAEDCLVEKDNMSPVLQERVHLIHKNALRLLKLVNTLLDFSRLEAGRVHATFTPVNLPLFTAELAGSFSEVMDRASLEYNVRLDHIDELVYHPY